MKNNGDVAQGWLKKAESDFEIVETLLETNKASDAACFHCQQAADKSVKGWLTQHNMPFPSEHDLEKLVKLCMTSNPGFSQLLTDAAALTPYAVKLRYALDFWPSIDEARIALGQARRIYQFVKDHWN